MADVRVPPACRGNLKEGFSVALVFINFAHAVGKCLCDMIATCESGRHKTCPYKVGVAAPP